MRIDQFHPSISYGDAIGQCLVSLRKTIRKMGLLSDIFAVHIDSRMKQYVSNMEYVTKKYTNNDILLVHYSIWDDAFKEMLKLPCKKILVYHNITPPEFFKGYNSAFYHAAQKGLNMLSIIRDNFIFALADSHFNAKELESYGYKDVSV